MTNVAAWGLLWIVAVMVAGGAMFAAWTGPHKTISNVSRWAIRLRIRHIPAWLSARAADRWAFRGGLVSLVLLLAVAWLVPWRQAPVAPAEAPNAGQVDRNEGATAPKPPGQDNAVINPHPDRHIDTELKNAILVNVPKTKQIRIVVLKDDPEANQFSWEIDAFVRAEGYTVLPRLLFAMATGGTMPSGTAVYPDEKDPNIVVIRIGLNDRS